MKKKKRLSVARREESLRSPFLKYGLIFLFVILLFEALSKFAEPRLLPIRHIKIDGKIEKVDLNNLRKRIKPYVKGFFSTNVRTLKREIISEPLIDQAIVKRVWPDTLWIDLTEITLVASWGGEWAVSSKGEVINAKVNRSKRLPLFLGPEGQGAKMLQVYNELSPLLAAHDLSITEIKLSSRCSWQIKLNDGIRLLLGRKEITAHLASLLTVYSRLNRTYENNIDYIDLRHSNGISVHLKTCSNPACD